MKRKTLIISKNVNVFENIIVHSFKLFTKQRF